MYIESYSFVNVSDISDSLVKSTDVMYYLSSSSSELLGGSWLTNPPAWVDGRYYWQKTVTIFYDDSTTETNPVCITGAMGATGRGVTSITEEYYLSTSKTTQSGSSWTTTPPTWSFGKYIWTRSKIVYSNPTSTVYTTPLCDSSWEAVNEIEIGGRNLATKTNQGKTGWAWAMQTGDYTMTDVVENGVNCCKMTRGAVEQTGWSVIQYSNIGRNNWEPDTTYTVSLDVKCSVNDSTFAPSFNESNGTNSLISSMSYIATNHTISNKWVPFIWQIKTKSTLPDSVNQNTYFTGMNSDINIWYQFRNLKIEKGNKATDWTAAPEDVEDHFTKVETTMSGVSMKVDNIDKSIKNEVWKSSMIAVTDPDGETVSKSIQDLLVQHNIDLNGVNTQVSDVKTIIGMNDSDYDASDTSTLISRIAAQKINADGIRNTVESNYLTKNDTEELIDSSSSSVMNQVSDMIDMVVEDNITGEKSYVNQKAAEYERVIGEEMFEDVQFRYIRDWVYSNDKDSENRFVECKVLNKSGTNVASDKTPTAYKEDGTALSDVTNLAYYTDEDITSSQYIYAVDLAMLQLDLGQIYADIDSIQIYHCYADGRTNATKLEISEDGTSWITLYDSSIDGSYVETGDGYAHKVQTESLSDQISFLKQTINSFNLTIQESEGNYSTIQSTVDTIIQRVEKTEGDVSSMVQEITDANGWKVSLAQIGAYEGSDIEPQETALSLSPAGITVTSSEKAGQRTVIGADSFDGYYNEGLEDSVDEKVFGINKDIVYTKRLVAEKGCDFFTIKAVPVTYQSIGGMVFVKSGGDS